eukprot:3358060-Alexandrium_andersonii.AAC.1
MIACFCHACRLLVASLFADSTARAEAGQNERKRSLAPLSANWSETQWAQAEPHQSKTPIGTSRHQ